ncbi:MAG: tetratricopeptide repeat protein, partial [Vicinamibacterales bacterium]
MMGRAAACSLVRAAVVGLWMALLLAPGTAVAQPAPRPRVLVMPLENVSRDGKIFWLSEAAAILLADDLNAMGVAAITRLERRKAFERLQVPPAAVLSDATVLRLGHFLGAASVVVGTLRLDGADLVVEARHIVLDSAKVRERATERGPLTDFYAIFERMARRFAPPGAPSTVEIEPQHPPVAAFEQYIKGVVAESPKTAAAYLRAALDIHPAFDRAKLALWEAYSEQELHERAAEIVSTIGAESPLNRRARFRLGLSQLALGRTDQAYEVFHALAAEEPSAAALNNLGIVQLRRGGNAETGLATTFFSQAAERTSGDSDVFFNLGYAFWMARDATSAIQWLREAVRRNAADGEAHYVLGVALASVGAAAEAAREKELARRLSSVFLEWDKRSVSDPIPPGLERIADDVPLPSEPEPDPVMTGQRDQQALAAFHIARGRRLYEQENDRDAVAELNRALFLAPYDAEANLLFGRIHLRAGRFPEAVGAFKIAIWSADTAGAHAALATAYLEMKDVESARAEAARALAMEPGQSEAQAVLDRV